MNMKTAMISTVFGLTVALQAAVIYQDDFEREGVTHPNGGTDQIVLGFSTPTTTTGGEWWKAFWSSTSSAFNLSKGDNALKTTTSTSVARGAFLDFVPESGKIYTLSVDMSVAGVSGTGFLAMGISSNTFLIDDFSSAQDAWDNGGKAYYSGPDSDYTNPMNSALSGFKLNYNNTVSSFNAAGYAGSSDFTGTVLAGYNTFEFVLDTRNANWEAEWNLNGTTIRTETYTENPDIHNVFLSFEDVEGGSYDDFSLTVVPEPATFGMLGLGSIGVVLFRRLVR